MSGILQDKHILVTRAEHQAEEFADQIKQHGGKPYIVPLLKISSIPDSSKILKFLTISFFRYILFSLIIFRIIDCILFSIQLMFHYIYK